MRIETSRLILETPDLKDEPDLLDALRASSSILREFPASLPWAMADQTSDLVKSFIIESVTNTTNCIDFTLLFRAKDGSGIVGCGGLHKPNFKSGRFELGFWGSLKFQGNGFITEAAMGLVSYALREFSANRIEVRVDEKNRRAIAVCNRVGFIREGILRNERADPDGTLRNTIISSITNAVELREIASR